MSGTILSTFKFIGFGVQINCEEGFHHLEAHDLKERLSKGAVALPPAPEPVSSRAILSTAVIAASSTTLFAARQDANQEH